LKEIEENIKNGDYNYRIGGTGYGYIRIGKTVYMLYCAACNDNDEIANQVENIRKRGYRPVALNIDNDDDCRFLNDIIKLLKKYGEDVSEFIC